MKYIAEDEALNIARQNGAFYMGHFIGTQGEAKGLGLHMPEYFDSRTLVTIPKVIEELAQGIAHSLAKYNIETIVGMPIGALTLGHEVAKALGCNYVMAEKTNDGLAITRSAFVELVKGKRVGIVEDTINEGTTILNGVKAVKEIGGIVVAAGGIINIGPLTSKKFGAPLHTLITRQTTTMSLQECLENGQCSRQEPINRRPGHGHDLERLVAEGVASNSSHLIFAD